MHALGRRCPEKLDKLFVVQPTSVASFRVDTAVPDNPDMGEERLGFGCPGPALRHAESCRLRRRELVVPEPLRQPFPGLDASLGQEPRDDVPRIAPAKELA